MKLYLIIIVIANLMIALINAVAFESFFVTLLSTLLSTVSVIVVDGAIIHIINAVFGFVILFLLIAVSITLPVAIVNAILMFLPTLVLRYNSPTLKYLYKKAKNKAV